MIGSGSGVRLKIKGRSCEAGNITTIGTVEDSCLDLVDDGSVGDG